MTRSCVLLGLVACGREYTFTSLVDVHPEEVTPCDFVDVPDAPGFMEYSCNPVFTASAEAWADPAIAHTDFLAVEVAGHAFYQIWYATGGQVGTAVSADGTDWIAHDDNPGWRRDGDAAWDAGSIQSLYVAWDRSEQRYHGLYNARNVASDFFGIGVASSEDGVAWTKHPDNPVLSNTLGVGDTRLAWPVSYEVDDGLHTAIFAAHGDTDALRLVQMSTFTPGLWGVADLRVVAEPGPPGSWDDEGFLDAAIVALDGRLWMFYVGFGEWIPGANGTIFANGTHFGVRVSDDGGASWQRPTNSFLPLENAPNGPTSVAARVINSRIHLWLTDDYPGIDAAGVGYFVFEPGEAP